MQNIGKVRAWTKKVGHAGESAAARMLEYKGFSIIRRNCRTPRGEIDIIARDGFSLVFVEVKTLFIHPGKKRLYRPLDNLKLRQKQRIVRAGLYYWRALGKPDIPVRYDVVEVLYSFGGAKAIYHYMEAFGANTVFRAKTDIFDFEA